MHNLLLSAITARVSEEVVRSEANVSVKHPMTEADKQQLIDSVYKFVVFAIPKYIAGKHEHGGLLGQRDSRLDLVNELIDAWFYAMTLKK